MSSAAPVVSPPGTSFASLGVSAQLVDALHEAGIATAFAVQACTVPDALAGRDVTGKAPTGSGKTLAFGIPMIERLPRARPKRPTGLVLVPTRELAAQIAKALQPLAAVRALRVHAFYGGASFPPQIRALERGVDIAVACPGRLLDLVSQRLVSLDDVQIAVVDEADRMADMGFLPDVRQILDLTKRQRQTLLFSATLDGDVDVLVDEYQRDPVHHEVAPPESAPVDHRFWLVPDDERADRCAAVVGRSGSTVVFVRTRHGADRLVQRLQGSGATAAALHGGHSQAKREQALDAFRRGRVSALVATDVAARGIHIDGVDCVVQFDLPADHKDYVHRAGRTGRAGMTGVVVSFVAPKKRRYARSLMAQLDLDAAIDAPDLSSVPASSKSTATTATATTATAAIWPAAAATSDTGAVRRPGSIGGVVRIT